VTIVDDNEKKEGGGDKNADANEEQFEIADKRD